MYIERRVWREVKPLYQETTPPSHPLSPVPQVLSHLCRLLPEYRSSPSTALRQWLLQRPGGAREVLRVIDSPSAAALLEDSKSLATDADKLHTAIDRCESLEKV